MRALATRLYTYIHILTTCLLPAALTDRHVCITHIGISLSTLTTSKLTKRPEFAYDGVSH